MPALIAFALFRGNSLAHSLFEGSIIAAFALLAGSAAAAPLPVSGTLDLGTPAPANFVRWNATEVNGLAGASVAFAVITGVIAAAAVFAVAWR